MVRLAMALALTALGGFFLILSVSAWLSDQEERRAWFEWPSVSGRVTKTDVEADDDGMSVMVHFSYAVKDREYSNTQAWASWCISCDTQEEERRYAPGTEVTVRYNPADPSEALVRPGFPGRAEAAFVVILGLLGGGLGLMGALGLLYSARRIWYRITWAFKRLLANVGSPQLYQCCFCGSSLPDPLQIAVEKRSGADGTQWLFCHMECLPRRLHPSFLATAFGEQKTPSYLEACCFCGALVSPRPPDPAMLVLPLPGGSTRAASHVKCLQGQVHPKVPLYLFEDDEEN